MGIHPKIGITGLPRSGKSAVMEKVLSMLREERGRELSARNLADETEIIGGICTEPILEDGERLGYKIRDLVTGDEGEIAHKSIDSRLRVLGYGLNTAELERVAIPAIQHAIDNCEVIVIDEIGKFAVESEAFVNSVRTALEVDKPTLLTLHKKSRHPLLQDIRRRDDGRILEVTPVNRALLPYLRHINDPCRPGKKNSLGHRDVSHVCIRSWPKSREILA
jgi:nucleoside-triphosphatase